MSSSPEVFSYIMFAKESGPGYVIAQKVAMKVKAERRSDRDKKKSPVVVPIFKSS